jgi:DNA-binding SARP family transcriptional activator/TolB-like protein/Flp pilus assembly protein TadD
MKPPARIRLRLLGRFALASDDAGAKPLRLTARKSCALLAYLAMSPEQTASREELATLLWGGCSDQQARQSLRQALAMLRKELGQPHFFAANTEIVRLQPGLWSVDACEFEKLTRCSTTEDLAQAGQLFRGEFLAGLNIDEEGFEEWVRGQRQRVQMAASRLCETYATRPDIVSNGEQAVTAAEHLLALDPLREDWQRWALTLYARYRGKTEALAQAGVFAEALQRELGVGPEKETCTLVDRIRAGEIAPIGVDPTPNEVANAIEPSGRVVETIAITASKSSLPPAIENESRGRKEIVQPLAIGLTVAMIAFGGIFALINEHPVRPHAGDPAIKLPAEAAVTDRWQPPQPASQPAWDVERLPQLFTKLEQGQPEWARGLRLALAPAGDPWASPRPPSMLPAEPTAAPDKSIIPILVLPFTTSGETAGSMQLLADTVTDDLTNLLSRVSSLRVISRQTALTYRGQPIDVAALGSELQVRYVLEGSMRMHGNMLRVNIELIDPTTRLPVWTTRIERDGADRQGVLDEIVGRLARELQFELITIEAERRSNDSDADALVARGWAALFNITPDGYRLAESFFRQALERDPQSLPAQIGMGAYHARIGALLLDNEPLDHRAKARDLLQDAIRRDPQSSAAHFYLGLALKISPTYQDAIEEFERAIEFNPSFPAAHVHIGDALAQIGRPAEGLEHIKYGIRLSPRDPTLGIFLDMAGSVELELNHFEAAIDYFRRSAVLKPAYARPWAGLAATYALAGRGEEALSYAEKLKASAPSLSAEQLIDQFGRNNSSQLREGLRLVFALQANSGQ